MKTTTEEASAIAPQWEEATVGSERSHFAGETIEMVPQLLRLKNVLVPIDFSSTAEKALSYALPFAEQFGAKLTLVHIINLTMRPMDYGLYEIDSNDYLSAAQKKVDAVLEEKLPTTLPQPVGTIIRDGIPWVEICAAAQETGADMIVLTTHGYTGLKRVLLGSTAEQVVRHAPCPVLVVREREHEFV